MAIPPLARAHGRRRRGPLVMLLLSLPLLAALAAPPPAAAQVGGTDNSGTGGVHSIQGRLVGPSGRRPETRFKVTLESSGFGSLYVFSDSNGSFRFTGLRPGSYRVVVEGGEDFENASEPVMLEASTIRTRSGVIGTPFTRPITLQIYLRPKGKSSDLAQPGVLDAALAGVPKAAVDLYQRGMEAARRGEHERAADLLKLAVEAHPNFPVALRELGFLHLKLKRAERAAEALSASLKLAPEDHGTLVGYGRALLELKRPAEAEEQFRKALRKNPASPWARFYLGVTLLRRRELEEAERELRAAAGAGGSELAIAHYYLGGIYWERKEYGRAADELETFLKLAPNAPEAARVRSTVRELRARR